MALDQTQNFVEVDITGTYTSTDTTISLESGGASEVPDPVNGEYNLVWFDAENNAKPSFDPEVEIVRVTGRDTGNDTLTVQRGQENTSAVAHDTSNADYKFLLTPTSKMISDIDNANFTTNSLTVANTTIALGGTGTPEADNLAGNNGTSGQFLQTDGSALSFTDLTVRDIQQLINNQAVIREDLARNNFEDTLAELNYQGGFYDIFRDTSKIENSSNVVISTLEEGDNDGKVQLDNFNTGITDGVESGSSELGWESTTDVSVNSNSEIDGTYSIELSTNDSNTTPEMTFSNPLTFTETRFFKGKVATDITNANDGFSLQLRNSNNDTVILIGFDDSDIFVQNSTNIAVSGYSTNTIYDFRLLNVDFDNETFDVEVNGDVKLTGISFDNSATEVTKITATLDSRFSTDSLTAYFDEYVYDTSTSTSYYQNGNIVEREDLSSGDDSFTNPPDHVTVNQRGDIPADEDIQYVVRDINGSGADQTITQADVGTQVDISDFTGFVVEVETQYSSTDGDDTPTHYSQDFYFEEGG